MQKHRIVELQSVVAKLKYSVVWLQLYSAHSYKPKDLHNKALTIDDFRGIAISCLLSKVYESCS